MQHLFLPYELALLAKEKGFDEPCFGIWMERGSKHDVIYVAKQDDAWQAEQNDGILAPLYQQLMNWFEEAHKLKIKNIPYTSGKDKWVIWSWIHIAPDNGYWEEVKSIKSNDIDLAIIEAFKIINDENN